MKRFVTMDGVRGLAAICVLIHHAFSGSHLAFAMSRAAVDMFFCLSGFVLSSAYGDRLGAGLSLSPFLRLRALRFFPLYALGLGLGFVVALIQLARGAPSAGIGAMVLALTLNLGFLPTPFSLGVASTGGRDKLILPYPFNPPSWSLFSELFANALFAVWRPRGVWRGALLGLGAVGIVLAPLVDGLSVPSAPTTFLDGTLRGVYGLYMGAFLFDLFQEGRLKAFAPAWLAPAATVAICLGLDATPILFLMVAILGSPLLIALSLRDPDPGFLSSLYTRLGRLSFPLYILHLPLLSLGKMGFDALHKAGWASPMPNIENSALVIALIIASDLLGGRLEALLNRAMRRTLSATVGAKGAGAKKTLGGTVMRG